MKSILDFFKSVKLAVALIIYIAITSILATLIPQGREIGFYQSQYPPLLASIIIGTQFHVFFTSILFLIPALFFTLNLAVCAIDRVVREVRNKAKIRIGVDLVHIGILILIVGGIVSLNREEQFQYMREGDELPLPGGQVLRLEKFEYYHYPDGRPKDWISVVDVVENGKITIDSFPIEVNKPLHVASWKIYQASFVNQLLLEDDKNHEYTAEPGQFIMYEDFAFVYRRVRRTDAASYRIIFEKWKGHSFVEAIELSPSDKIGDFVIKGVQDFTGLQLVRDPGYLFVIISLVLISIGLSITYIQKIGEKTV